MAHTNLPRRDDAQLRLLAASRLGRYVTRAGTIAMLDREVPGGRRQGFIEGAAAHRHLWYQNGQSRTRPELDLVAKATEVGHFDASEPVAQAAAIADVYGRARYLEDLTQAIIAYGRRCVDAAIAKQPRPSARLKLAGRID